MNRHATHVTTDELIDHLYGLTGPAAAHLKECAECAARSNALGARRRELMPGAPASAEFLAAQRRKIYARLDQRPNHGRKWIPAVAAASALAIALLVYKPVVPPAPRPDPGDAQLFAEVYSMEQLTEPEAAAPIHGLFEDR